MASRTQKTQAGPRCILIADEDPKVVAFMVQTFREDGHAVFHAYDGPDAIALVNALNAGVDLLITNTRVSGRPGVGLIYEVRRDFPDLPIMYIADIDRSTPAIEAKLPRDVPILREPFTAEQLRAVVNPLLARAPGLLDIGR
jgi:DNA-binding response OmpR family regulator